MHGLRFTVPGQGYPFEATVRVSWPDGTYQFRLTAKGGKVVAADRCAEPKRSARARRIPRPARRRRITADQNDRRSSAATASPSRQARPGRDRMPTALAGCCRGPETPRVGHRSRLYAGVRYAQGIEVPNPGLQRGAIRNAKRKVVKPDGSLVEGACPRLIVGDKPD